MRRTRGFTLLEVVMAAGLSTLVLGIAYQLLFAGSRAARSVESLSTVTDVVGSAMVQLSRRVRYVQTIEVPAPGETRDRLEYADVEQGAWTLTVEDGELILAEKLGLERRTLARGLHAVRFTRDAELPQLLFVSFEVEVPAGVQRYRSAVYARGSRRAHR